MKKVSLAINSHNPRPDWLFECLDSAQGFDEIVFYCQCVEDSLFEKIKQYIIDNPEKNIVLINDNIERDIVDGFNLAIRSTTSEWVCSFCDDDKFITQNLQEIISEIKSGKYDDADVVHFKVFVNGCELWGEENVSSTSLMSENRLPHGSFFKRSMFDEIDGYRVECCTDWEFWLRAALLGYRFKYFALPVYDFRYGHNSAFKKQMRKYNDPKTLVIENAKNYICSRQVY